MLIMRFTPLISASIFAGAGLAVSACSDSNAPPTNAATYDLASYGGQPLPVVLRVIAETSIEPGGPTVYCDDKLTASTLQLLTSSRFMQTDSRLVVCDDGRADVASEDVLQGTYTTGADTVVLAADVGAGTHYNSFARITSGTLTIYRRVSVIDSGASTTDPTALVFHARQ